jgi:hypothetical protein
MSTAETPLFCEVELSDNDVIYAVLVSRIHEVPEPWDEMNEPDDEQQRRSGH